VNQSIYGGAFMIDSLLQPYQCLPNNVQIDTCPKCYFPNDTSVQTIQFEDKVLPLQFHGPLPFIHVHHPKEEDFHNCPHYDLTSSDEWNPCNLLSSVNQGNTDIPYIEQVVTDTEAIINLCSISSELMNYNYFSYAN
jgi:hypothetical protein